MTSEEFSLHLAYWSVEPAGPLGDVQRWAALMAAVVNGPRVRKNKQPFKPEDFWPATAWDDEAARQQPQLVTRGGKKATLAPDLSAMRGMRVANTRRR